ncbi:MAG TPA: selenocysteine-specific translation elongation factor [Candidatus Limnocylindrales bacterium]|nr:selenocysteine-specific translation elongation factor [Candidatus Limnocylindrales bacterium]
MTVVVGTAGHIDHGKTTLLRALTGIDADRLPEERRRGMTIDVGYAHLTLPDGTELDFVDVPGHDRLVGNMLVGAGEIDAALLVVAADDGIRAQTLEHLALLDALDVRHAVVAVTKADFVPPDRVADVTADVIVRLSTTALAGSPVFPVSATTGDGIEALGAALVGLRDRVLADPSYVATAARPSRLAIDRVFGVKGRGTVVTGTLCGGPLEKAASLRVVPGDATVRVREVQVHGSTVEHIAGGGRTALNLAGQEPDTLRRGAVLTSDSAIRASDRLLVRLAVPVPDRSRFRLHLGTAAAEVSVGRSGRDAVELPNGAAAILRLEEPLAVAIGDRFVLRRSGGEPAIVGGVVLDPSPVRGVSRKRQTRDRVVALAEAVAAADAAAISAARTDLHGILPPDSVAVDVRDAARTIALDEVEVEPSLTSIRASVARALRRAATVSRERALTIAASIVDRLVVEGQLVRDGDWVRAAGRAIPPADPELEAAMDRLVSTLDVVAPPSLRQAAAEAGCPSVAIRELERSGRIAILEDDLAYAMTAYRDLAAKALSMSAREPLTPAAFRDATGTSRRYVLAILEDLDRRAILRRTADGHVPGPRAPARLRGDS